MLRNPLGKGLAALITESGNDEVVQQIPIGQLTPNPYQPRRTFPEESLRELAETIKQSGILQPLVVRRLAHDRYEIIAGERRWRAAQIAEQATVPALIRQADDEAMLALALVENLQREDINPADAAISYRRLADEFGLTQEEIAARVGKSRGQVSNTIRLVNLPAPIFESVRAGRINEGHARALLSLEDPEQQRALHQAIVDEDLTVRDAELRSRLLRNKVTGRDFGIREAVDGETDPEWLRIETAMSEALGVRVRLMRTGPGSGRIIIPFYTEQQLSKFLEWLRV